MCYCNCPHEDVNGCCREDECIFLKNGLTPPTAIKDTPEIGKSSAKGHCND